MKSESRLRGAIAAASAVQARIANHESRIGLILLFTAAAAYGQEELPKGAVARLGTVRMVHEDYVNTIAWAPHGVTFASGGTDGTIRIWEASTGRETARFASPTREVRALAFSPDGATLASGSYDGPIHVWEVKAGKETASFAGHKGGVVSLAFSADGKSILSGGADGVATVWDASTGAETQRLEGHRGDVRAWFAKDGRIATAGADGTARTWEGGRERTRIKYERHVDLRTGMAGVFGYAYKDQVLATDLESGTECLKAAVPRARSLAFSADGAWIAVGDERGTVTVRETAGGREVLAFRPTGIVTSLAYSPDGWTIVSGGSDGTIVVWDAKTGAKRHAPGHTGAVVRVAFAADGRSVATGGEDGTVRVWDAEGRQRLNLKWTHQRVGHVSFGADGKTLVSAEAGYARVSDAATGEEIARCKPDAVSVGATAAADWLATAAYSAHEDGYWVNAVRVWDAATGRALRDFTFETDATEAPTAIAASADGSALAVLGSERSVVVLDAQTGLIRQRVSAPSRVARAAVSPDGTWLATSSDTGRRGGGAFVVWSARRGAEVARVQAHNRALTALAFSADGQLVATASEGTVRLWELATLREIASFSSRARAVLDVAFSPDGRRLAVACDSGSAYVWDPAAPQSAAADALWTRLGSSDAREAAGAMAALVAAGDQGVAVARERASTSTADSEEVRALMRDLDGEDIDVREKAAKRLEELEAEAPLREAKHAAAQAVLAALDRPQIRSADRLRLTRAVQVLERIGTPAAKEALQMLAKGRPMRASREAQAALVRLAARK